MTAPVRPCMGGFCALRGRCAHHQTPDNRNQPAEALCDRGHEAEMFFLPIKPQEAKQ